MADSSRPLPAGKLPADLLARLLPTVKQNDPRVIVGPRVGTDAAAIDMGTNVLIVKSDPITFATEDAGWYLVNVNANDIACMGGTPKWLLVTVLLPEHSTTPALVTNIFESLQRACAALNIALVGGHTEITIGIDRPLLIGSMLGEASHADLIDPVSVRAGDAILLCKGIAIEGTALLARESAPALLAGLDPDTLNRCRQFLVNPGISVVSTAAAIRSSGVHVKSLHDPTEGGIASALHELCSAAGLGATVAMDAIKIYPETLELCKALDLDPLGLIASGALLAVVPPDAAETVCSHLRAAGTPCAQIGTFNESPGEVVATRNGSICEFPVFEVDEIARFFARQ